MELHNDLRRGMSGKKQHREILEETTDDGEDDGAPHFNSTLGLIVSCMGCVVGTGNIWRFPRIVANNSNEEGGLVFLIVWIFFLFLWSSPLLLLEYGTGRYTKRAVVGSFQTFLNDNHIWCGAWVSLVTFCISCFYAVVLGWCFYYCIHYMAYSLPDTVEVSRVTFYDFARDSYWPILTHFIAILLAGLCVTKGVKTIEKVSMVLVPVLLLIVLFVFVWSLTRRYADHGIKFLFTPHWKSFGNPRLWVDAVSQNAFDTGAGMGLMIPYSSYMTKKNGIVRYGHLIPVANNVISLVCGITVFGTVFSSLIITKPYISHTEIVNIMKDSGPASTGLTFIWIPVLLETVGTFGRVLAVLFFICLSFAGITSLMSNFELLTHTFEDFGLPRRFGMPLTILLTFLVGLPSALNLDVLTNQDFVWGFALVVNGMMLMYMVVRFGVRRFRETVVNRYGVDDWKLTLSWEIIIKFIAPVEAVFLIVWWAIDLITSDDGDGEHWYDYGRETLVMTLTQWFGLMLVLILANYLVVTCKRKFHLGSLSDEIQPLLQSDNSFMTSSGGVAPRNMDGSVGEIRL